MGRIKQNIWNGISGKIGPVVGCRKNSTYYLRAQAARVSNPRTPDQQAQRGRFATAFAFLQGIKPYIRIGYREEAKGKSAFNAAMSYLLKKAVNEGSQGAELDFRRVLVSVGSLMTAPDGKVTVNNGKAMFTWTDNSGLGNAEGSDTAMPLVYNRRHRMAVYITEGALRKDGQATLPLPKSWEKEELVAYLGFYDPASGRVSNSLFLTVGETAG